MAIPRIFGRRTAASADAEGESEGLSEGSLLRSVFFAMLTASIVMLVFDLSSMIERSADEFVDSNRIEPVVMEPPSDTDQERPYYPKAMPMAPGGLPPLLPGLTAKPTPAMLANRMSFAIDDAGKASAVGRIEAGTAADFDRFLKDNAGRVKQIWFHSPGGSVADAIAMARAIRKANISTAVPENGYCASSCPLAYSGGVTREAGRKAWIGVHQIFTLPTETGTLQEGLANAQRISAECQELLVSMGVDPRVWIYAMRTAKQRLYVFTAKELSDFKIVTPATAASAGETIPGKPATAERPNPRR